MKSIILIIILLFIAGCNNITEIETIPVECEIINASALYANVTIYEEKIIYVNVTSDIECDDSYANSLILRLKRCERMEITDMNLSDALSNISNTHKIMEDLKVDACTHFNFSYCNMSENDS